MYIIIFALEKLTVFLILHNYNLKLDIVLSGMRNNRNSKEITSILKRKRKKAEKYVPRPLISVAG